MKIKRLLPSASTRQPAGFRAPGAIAVFCVIIGLMTVAPGALAQKDDFNDGNDMGWTNYSPLAGFGVPGIFSVAGGAYRIRTTAPSPNPMQLGPPRAGSLRADLSFTDFYVSVDLVDWKDDTRQSFGILARVQNAALGMTIGYAFTYDRGSGVTPTSGDLDISKITAEVPSGVQTGPSGIHLDPANDYRFVFIGRGTQLEGRVYQLPNTDTPLITISGSDATYSNGTCGLVIYDNSGGSGMTDATFDNYCGLPEEPPRLIYNPQPLTQEIEIYWPNTYTGYILQSSPVLPATVWTDEPSTDVGMFYYFLGPMDSGNRFFRLKKTFP